jgi:hypothetical protein
MIKDTNIDSLKQRYGIEEKSISGKGRKIKLSILRDVIDDYHTELEMIIDEYYKKISHDEFKRKISKASEDFESHINEMLK